MVGQLLNCLNVLNVKKIDNRITTYGKNASIPVSLHNINKKHLLNFLQTGSMKRQSKHKIKNT